ncbi:MAG: hypothetical protein ACXWZZ_00580, partial [Solirubrobacteraceae bacterium]
ATEKVEGLPDADKFADKLKQMREEAEETETRCTELAENRDGKKTAILEKAQETKGEATDRMSTYLGGESDGLDGFEFLTMAEAGEVGHWAIVKTLNQRDGDPAVAELAEWALLIQEDHLKAVLESSLALASRQDPRETIE